MTADTLAATDFFNANPKVTLVIVGLGHPHGKAKFNSRCKLTGGDILAGEAVRHVTGMTRNGGAFDLYVSNRAVAYMEMRTVGDFYATTYSRCSEGWTGVFDNAATGTTIEVVQHTDNWHKNKVYTMSANGKWAHNTAGVGTYSTKQVKGWAAGKRNILWRLVA